MASVINNGIPLINGMLCSWADIVITIGGVPLTGVLGVDYGEDQYVENKYGAGRYPIGRAKGRIKPWAKIKIYREELVGLQNRSANGRLQDLPPFDIGISMLPDSGIISHDTIRNCHFKDNARRWTEGDTGQEVELELIPSHIEWGKSL